MLRNDLDRLARHEGQCCFVAEGAAALCRVLARIELTPTAPSDEEEKTRVGRRARPPTLLQLVQGGR